MKKLRVLVFSATFGAGHVRAADAIIEAIGLRQPNAEISHLDCGEFLSKTFNSLMKGTYIGMIKYSPRLWGKLYYGTTKLASDSLLQRFLNNMGINRFEQYIQMNRPDIIICTYPTVAGVLAQLRQKQRLHIPVVTVITDYVVHSQWVHSGVDLYIVGSEEVRKGLICSGINLGRIKVTGIPVSPVFEQPVESSRILEELGLKPYLPTVLVMGGAYGVLEGLGKMCKELDDQEIPLQQIVVCGRDKKLYNSLNSVVENARHPIARLGYVNNVQELMSVARLMVTKAGGLTVSEALTKRLPIVIFRPIPGQEEENANFLRRSGAGKVTYTLEELKDTVISLLQHSEEVESMGQCAAAVFPGKSADRAVEHILGLLDEANNQARIG